MAEEVRFPRLGWSMEEGRFIGWLKKDGDWVEEGAPLFEMEGEKAIQEVEALTAGILRISTEAPKPDSVVLVGRLMGHLLSREEVAGTSIPAPPINVEDRDHSVGASELNGMTSNVGGSLDSKETKQSSPRVLQQTKEPIAGEHDRSGENSVGRLIDGGQRKRSSPRARRLARELGISLEQIKGSGRGGRIREVDIRRANPAGTGEVTASSGMTPRRRAIAERLRRSVAKTIPVTLHTIVDVSHWVQFREQQKVLQSSYTPSYTDLFAKVVAGVLQRHPALSKRWEERSGDLVDVNSEGIGIGIAVDTKDGLLVPVVTRVAERSIEEIVMESRRLIAKARAGGITAAEMQGGVITLTNLGAYGIDGFTPILNYPGIAILGMGVIRSEPVFIQDATAIGGKRLEARERMVLSLTFDHAAVDGAPAAAFLKDIVDTIQGKTDV